MTQRLEWQADEAHIANLGVFQVNAFPDSCRPGWRGTGHDEGSC
jgi:hypothetical protein